jgi:uncharacterized membrane protein YbhN (UPF0104 family)
LSRRAWVLAILSAAGLAMAIRFGLAFPWGATVNALANADPVLLAGAAAANLLSLAVKGGAWYLLLRRIGGARAATTQAATLVAAAVNSITVAGSGEAVRAQLVHDKDGIPYGRALASLVATRMAEALGLLIFLALALLLTRPRPGAGALAAVMVVLAAAVVVSSRLVPLRMWHPSIAGLSPANGVGWTAPVLLGSLNWAAQWMAYHWSIQSTHVAITPAASLTALLAANISGILRLTPGNFGIMQGSIVLGLDAFRIPAAQALAAGLALQAVQVLPVITLALGIMGARGFRQLASQRAGTV